MYITTFICFLRRSRSDPYIYTVDDDTLLVPQSYNTAVEEVVLNLNHIVDQITFGVLVNPDITLILLLLF